ncbi:M16 family metallopeptidase [Herbaspirillum rubrisubalbicans]|uniref:Insulinase family protein n=1 Tax=Herbaspirillum rubrisubalbicans TaxID=80842 RepID=A0AAD0XIB4_9BURK|nr:pitrilysin family protein [Herbaspirillum rubrisubalbicans]AYR25669.1 insulinase family protein [Herbaspirillum rubrisubalbicans]
MSLRHLRLAILSVSFGFILAAPASQAATSTLALPAGVSAGPSAEGISEYHFANGFKLLLLPDDSKPTVTVNITYLVGSRHENYGETGMAHLLEHLMFKGSPQHPAIPQEFSKRGMNFNGTTWLDRTNYYESFQAGQDNLQWAITMEADRMVNSKIARKDLDSEMTVVRNEYEAGETSPARVMLKRMQSVAYDWHSYGRNTIGARSDIENVRIENLQAFYRTYYQPDNAVLIIAGKFEPGQVLQWVNQSFGRLPKPKRKLPAFWTVEPTQDGERQFTIRRRGDLQLVALGYKMPSALHPDATALSFASDILTDTPNGRLHKSLVQTGLATEVYAMPLAGYAPGLQIIVAKLKAGADIEPVKQAMIATVESFNSNPPTAEEMARLRRESANNFETLQNNPQQMAVAMSNAIARGDWRLLFIERDLEQRLSSADIATAAGKYFRRDNRTVGLYIPEDHPQRAEIPPAPSVDALLAQYQPRAPIAAGEAFDPAPGNIEQRTTRIAPGQPPHAALKLALLPKQSRGQTVSVSMNLEFGDADSLFGQRAVAQLTAAMLMRGTSTLDRRQLADEFTRLKINGNVYRFQTTRENLNAAIALAGEVLRHPRMDPAEFAQLKNETVAALEATRKEPDARAAEALQLHFDHYPAGDWRAARTLEERIAAVQAVTLEQVLAFHRRFYGASHGEVAIVGDFDAQAARSAIDQAFASWSSAAPYARILRTWSDIAPERILIDTPDKENGVYLARQNLRLRDDDPDYAALVVANYLLGASSLKSRLGDRVRQQDGLSYGINSGLQIGAISDAGYLVIHAIATPQNMDKVDAAVREELERLLKDGFSEDELLRAKSGILQQRNQQRSSDGGMATGWTALLNLDRSFLWQQQLDLKLADLTLAQLNAAVRKYIDPARMTVVMARDAAKAAQR